MDAFRIVILKRPRQRSDLVRSYRLFVDGRFIAKIRESETLRLQIPADAKQLVAKLDWCSSPAFDLVDSGDAELALQVKNTSHLRVFSGAWALVITLAVIGHVLLNGKPAIVLPVALLFLGAMFWLVPATFRRRHYLGISISG